MKGLFDRNNQKQGYINARIIRQFIDIKKSWILSISLLTESLGHTFFVIIIVRRLFCHSIGFCNWVYQYWFTFPSKNLKRDYEGGGGRMEDYKHFLRNTPACANNTTCMCLAETWRWREAKKIYISFFPPHPWAQFPPLFIPVASVSLLLPRIRRTAYNCCLFFFFFLFFIFSIELYYVPISQIACKDTRLVSWIFMASFGRGVSRGKTYSGKWGVEGWQRG